MNAVLASLVPFALVTALCVPLLWAAVRPGQLALRASLIWTLGVTSVVGLLQSGLLVPGVPDWVTADKVRPAQIDRKACGELIKAMRQYNVLLEEPRAGKVVANQELWRQLPSNVQDFVTQCAESDGEPAEVSFAAAR